MFVQGCPGKSVAAHVHHARRCGAQLHSLCRLFCTVERACLEGELVDEVAGGDVKVRA